jgi:hypothetical protein
MHAEAVRQGGVPSKPDLIHDASRVMTCDECEVAYFLYYDCDAEPTYTYCSILAAELITARHPDHEQVIVLELPEQTIERPLPKEIVWSARLNLGTLLKKKPDVI